jgi:5-methylthioadenosine/S-adenosylhomocysteine deaminase
MAVARTSFLALATIAIVSAQPPRVVDLVIANGIVVTMDSGRRVINPGSVAISGTTITAVGESPAIAAQYPARTTIEARGRVVMPGLINTHTHAPMVLYRGLADDLPLLAALEMIRSGTTTYADMYYFEEEIARATKEAGLRGVLGQTVIEFPVPDAKTPAAALARAEAFIKQFSKDDLIVPAVAPHSVYTLDAATLTATRDLAIKYGVPVLIHLGETQDEIKMALDRHKMRPVALLEQLAFWRPLVIAAHGVWMNADEIAVLKKNNVGVSHNPESNMKLASGTAPVQEYLRAGVALGLGTDGAASNNDLDMFEAMRQAAFLHKLVSRDPRAVSAQTALEMGTLGGARVIGRADRLGSLEAGKLADVVVVRMDQPRQTPMYDAVSHLVYVTRGDDVETTIVNGKVLMRDRKVLTLNEADVLAEARKAAAQVRSAVSR